MPVNLPPWLFFALPPVLGALIGYVTNALAIRMLFRPLTKKYFLGIPLPLTPGIIPRQRDSLAHSIARMVSRSLFNAQVINTHIKGEKFQSALKVQLAEILSPSKAVSAVLDNEVKHHKDADETSANKGDSLPSENPRAADDPRTFIRERIAQLEELILPVLSSPISDALLKRLIDRLSGDVGHRSVASFLPVKARNREDLEKFFSRQIRGETFRRLKWGAILWIRRNAEANTALEKFFSRNSMRRTVHILDRLYVPGVNFLMDFLRRPEIRRELVKRGKVILSDILLRLSPVQRIMLSAGQYDRTLEENMPEIIRDLLRTLEKTLRSAENRDKILSAVHELMTSLQSQGLGDLQERYSIDLSRNFYRIFDGIQALLIRENASGRLADYIADRTGEEGGPSIDEVLQSYAGLTFRDILERGYELLQHWKRDESRRDRFRQEISEIIAGARRPPLKEIRVEDAGEDQLLVSLSSALTMLMEGAVPSLVERFDIYQMVVDRINALDIEEVEQLLLGIIARHLKYINIFGAVLGAMIGGAQLLLSFLN